MPTDNTADTTPAPTTALRWDAPDLAWDDPANPIVCDEEKETP